MPLVRFLYSVEQGVILFLMSWPPDAPRSWGCDRLACCWYMKLRGSLQVCIFCLWLCFRFGPRLLSVSTLSRNKLVFSVCFFLLVPLRLSQRSSILLDGICCPVAIARCERSTSWENGLPWSKYRLVSYLGGTVYYAWCHHPYVSSQRPDPEILYIKSPFLVFDNGKDIDLDDRGTGTNRLNHHPVRLIFAQAYGRTSISFATRASSA